MKTAATNHALPSGKSWTTSLRLLHFLAILSALVTASAQALTYSENFNSMASGTAPPAGWSCLTVSGSNTTWGTTVPITLTAVAATAVTPLTLTDAPTANNNNGYNALGASGLLGDRCLATAPTSIAGAVIQSPAWLNNSGGNLASFTISYDIKRFTVGSGGADELPGYWLFYTVDGGTTWTNAAALNPTLTNVPNTVGLTSIPTTTVILASPWTNGGYLQLRWVDDNGIASSPDQIIGLDNVILSASAAPSPLAVAITSPANNSNVANNFTINATATVSPATIARVDFYDGATLLGTDTSNPYSYTWTTASPGSHALTAVATDSTSLTATSAVVNVNVTVSGTVTRGPYLQMAAPTRMTVCWRGSQSVAGRVRYGNNLSNLDHFQDDAAAPPSPFNHVIALTGLTPATTYYYSIGSAADTLASGADYTFTTPPPTGTVAATRIWALGDAGTANGSQTAVRDAFYTWTGARTPNLVLQLGDNAYNSGTDAEFQGAMFDIYPTLLRKTPFWSCLGNHETNQLTDFNGVYPYFDIYTLPTAGECGGVASGTEHYYSFNYANIHLIALDSMTASRLPTGAMATWLQSDLASNTATWTVCFFHHPPYTKGSHDSDTETELIEMRQNLLPILEAGGVDLVLCGHSHSYERSYLLDKHYGLSTTLTPAMKKNAGDGRPAGNGAYIKPLSGPRDHFGAVYAVAGSAGQTSGGALNHPAHFISLNQLGSLVLDVNGTRLDATFLRDNSSIQDTFTIVKQGAADSDGDGIPDAYEIAHGLNRFDSSDALLDLDGDGVSNLDEYILGSAADVPDHYAFTTTYDNLAGTASVSFPTLVGRNYRVMYSPDLLSWQAASSLPGTGATVVWTDDGTTTGSPPAAANRRFYRLEVTLAP